MRNLFSAFIKAIFQGANNIVTDVFFFLIPCGCRNILVEVFVIKISYFINRLFVVKLMQFTRHYRLPRDSFLQKIT